VLQVIATATIASFIGLGGLGRIITSGIALNDYDRILGGAILVTALALFVDALFALAQRATRTPGVGAHASRPTTASRRRSTRPGAVVGISTDEGKK
jgi:osmoprotectant transport system permease protein